MRDIKKLIIHCSDSRWGDVEDIRSWHIQRGWNDCGYSYVITNCYPDYDDYKNKQPNFLSDGVIQEGRDVRLAGAHTRGYNGDSIGICLIGKDTFTGEQIRSLRDFVKDLMVKYGLDKNAVYGHYEFDVNKTCPNLDMDWFRNEL